MDKVIKNKIDGRIKILVTENIFCEEIETNLLELVNKILLMSQLSPIQCNYW